MLLKKVVTDLLIHILENNSIEVENPDIRQIAVLAKNDTRASQKC